MLPWCLLGEAEVPQFDGPFGAEENIGTLYVRVHERFPKGSSVATFCYLGHFILVQIVQSVEALSQDESHLLLLQLDGTKEVLEVAGVHALEDELTFSAADHRAFDLDNVLGKGSLSSVEEGTNLPRV